MSSLDLNPELPATTRTSGSRETLEDYTLRYAPLSFRRWGPGVVAVTALGGIAEPRYDAAGNASTTVYQCVSCEEEYERPDVMHSHKHQGAICSLCKSME
ncbi:hypothetical protein AB5D36_004259 [Klebsiella pneumoniae]